MNFCSKTRITHLCRFAPLSLTLNPRVRTQSELKEGDEWWSGVLKKRTEAKKRNEKVSFYCATTATTAGRRFGKTVKAILPLLHTSIYYVRSRLRAVPGREHWDNKKRFLPSYFLHHFPSPLFYRFSLSSSLLRTRKIYFSKPGFDSAELLFHKIICIGTTFISIGNSHRYA